MGWTTFDLNTYEARNKPKHRDAQPIGGCDDEAQLHEEIRQECLKRGWLAFYGSMAHSTWRVKGEPDYIVLCDYPRVLLIEAKTKKGKLSEHQLQVQAWAKKLGHTLYVVRSIEEFNQIANEIKDNHENDNTRMPEHHQSRD